ncbi:hypothetical protein [Methylobacterium fujisawaense]
MKVVAKEHLTAGTLIEYGQANDGKARECRTTAEEILKKPPQPGDVIVEHATHIDWMPFDEFREHYAEVV